ncbi:MAG TPA: response regulator [Methylomirabilota bacterium]|nr:response regulator [Methylomirabilota bacterium]
MIPLRPILLVEDNLNDIELTCAALKQNKVANEIVITRHGGDALDYLYHRGGFQNRGNEIPIVVLLDLKMPKVDGLEVLRQMKSDESLKSIPVVMLTSSREDADLIKSYRLGVNAYVVKPVGFEKFTDAIRELGVFWAMVNEPPPGG